MEEYRACQCASVSTTTTWSITQSVVQTHTLRHHITQYCCVQYFATTIVKIFALLTPAARVVWACWRCAAAASVISVSFVMPTADSMYLHAAYIHTCHMHTGSPAASSKQFQQILVVQSVRCAGIHTPATPTASAGTSSLKCHLTKCHCSCVLRKAANR